MAVDFMNSKSCLVQLSSQDSHSFKGKFLVAFFCLITRSLLSMLSSHLVGIIANNGPMTEPAALKAAHFVQLCDQRDLPLLFLQNSTPYKHAEKQGDLIRSHAKLMSSVACATVPKITIIVGNSIGADNYMMVRTHLEFKLYHVKSTFIYCLFCYCDILIFSVSVWPFI